MCSAILFTETQELELLANPVMKNLNLSEWENENPQIILPLKQYSTLWLFPSLSLWIFGSGSEGAEEIKAQWPVWRLSGSRGWDLMGDEGHSRNRSLQQFLHVYTPGPRNSHCFPWLTRRCIFFPPELIESFKYCCGYKSHSDWIKNKYSTLWNAYSIMD